jgi:hypothetical protein
MVQLFKVSEQLTQQLIHQLASNIQMSGGLHLRNALVN